MTRKGSYLYYGYKLTEEQFKTHLLDPFKDYIIDDEDKNVESVMKLHRIYNLTLFFDKNQFFGRICSKCNCNNNKAEPCLCYPCCYYNKNKECECPCNCYIEEPSSNITINYNKCCAYDKSWVIGINLCHIPAFKNEMSTINMKPITENDMQCLETIKIKFGLPVSDPGYYAVLSDCWSCT